MTARRLRTLPAILAVSTSMKTTSSASRSLLYEGARTLGSTYPAVVTIDLATQEVPLFRGQQLADHPVAAAFEGASGVLFAVPCYWNSVSGVFKNLLDVLCGPAYDLAEATTPLSGKVVGIVVVGADDASAQQGHVDARRILKSTGARVLDRAVVIGNPRRELPASGVQRELTLLVAELAKAVLAGGRDD